MKNYISRISFNLTNDNISDDAYFMSESVMDNIWDGVNIPIEESIKATAAINVNTDPDYLIETYSNPDFNYYYETAEEIFDCNDELFTTLRYSEQLRLVTELFSNVDSICRNAIKEYLCARVITIKGKNAKKIDKLLIDDITVIVNNFEYEDGMYCSEVIPLFEDELFDCFKYYENKYNVKIDID